MPSEDHERLDGIWETLNLRLKSLEPYYLAISKVPVLSIRVVLDKNISPEISDILRDCYLVPEYFKAHKNPTLISMDLITDWNNAIYNILHGKRSTEDDLDILRPWFEIIMSVQEELEK
jgi:hypothetical protein